MQSYREFPFLIITGLLLTFLLTWPLVTRINSFYADELDHGLAGWILWYNQHAFVSGKIFDHQAYFDSNQFYPFPQTLAYSDHLFIPSLIFAPIYWLSNGLIFSVNYYLVLTFVFTFISSFYCLNFFVRQKLASLVGAFVFTFNPLTFSHLGHLQLMGKFFIPPLFLFAFLYIKNPTIKNSFFFFLFFTLNALSAFYFQVFSLILIPIFWMPFLITQILRKNVKYFLSLRTSFIGLAFLPLLLYFNLPYLKVSSLEGAYRTLGEISFYSARGIDWISSLETNFIYGNFVRSLYPFREPKDPSSFFNYSEHTLFINIVPIVLAMIGIFSMRKNVTYFSLCLLLFFSAVFTFGPYFYDWSGKKVIGTSLYLPIYQSSVLFTSIRVVSRFQFIFYLPLSILVAFGASRFLKLSNRFSLLIFAILGFFLLLENINITNFDSQSPTLNYINLKKEGKFVLVDLLSGKNTIHFPLYLDVRNVKYLNWSTQTVENIFNGYSGYVTTDWVSLAGKIKKLDQSSLFKIYLLGIDYLIIHNDLLSQKDLKEYQKNAFLHQGLVFNDGKIKVIDLKKFKFQPSICKISDLKFEINLVSYPIAQLTGTTFQLLPKLTLVNPKNCYLVSKYHNRYSQVEVIIKNKKQTLPIKLPILLEPFEKVKVN